jgi:hypothetical protein
MNFKLSRQRMRYFNVVQVQLAVFLGVYPLLLILRFWLRQQDPVIWQRGGLQTQRRAKLQRRRTPQKPPNLKISHRNQKDRMWKVNTKPIKCKGRDDKIQKVDDFLRMDMAIIMRSWVFVIAGIPFLSNCCIRKGLLNTHRIT